MALAAALLVVLALALAPRAAAGDEPPPLRDARLAGVQAWAFALGEGQLRPGAEQRLGRYDLVIVDGEEAGAPLVAALRARGTLVLAYLSVGTIERGRSWYPRAKPYRLEFWPDWGEWYADTSRPGFRSLLADGVAPAMLAKGFDGLFLDNTDMVETHPRQAKGMRALVARLDALGGLLFTQNGEDALAPIVRHLDGWNREDVSRTYDFDTNRYVAVPPAERRAAVAALRRLRARGLLTLATDYVRPGDERASRAARRTACDAGALSFVADIGLRRLPAEPPRC